MKGADAHLADTFARMCKEGEQAFDMAAGQARFLGWMQGAEESNPPMSAGKHRRPEAVDKDLPAVDIARLKGGPLVMRVVLGKRLRAIREACGITIEQAAQSIRGSVSKMYRIEFGRSAIRRMDVADLLNAYGVTDRQERELIFYLTDQSMARAWWHNYAGVLPGWFMEYMGLEDAATQIKTYHAQHIPGLLQTPAYAREVAKLSGPEAADEDIQKAVDMVSARQESLTGSCPPRLLALIDQATLYRPVGGHDVMRDQLRHLIMASQWPRMDIRIVPLDSVISSVVPCSFSILSSGAPGLPEKVYFEHPAGALYLDREADVALYHAAMQRLEAGAYPAAKTVDVLLEHLGEPGVPFPPAVRMQPKAHRVPARAVARSLHASFTTES